MEQLGRTDLQLRDGRKIDAAAPSHVQRILIAELAVVVGNAADTLRQVPLRRAARVNKLKDGAYEAAIAVGLVGGDKLGPPHGERNAAVLAHLGEQARARDDGATSGVLDQSEVGGTDQRVT